MEIPSRWVITPSRRPGLFSPNGRADIAPRRPLTPRPLSPAELAAYL